MPYLPGAGAIRSVAHPSCPIGVGGNGVELELPDLQVKWCACLEARPGIADRCMAAMYGVYLYCFRKSPEEAYEALKSGSWGFAGAWRKVQEHEETLHENFTRKLMDYAPFVPEATLHRLVQDEGWRLVSDGSINTLAGKVVALQAMHVTHRMSRWPGALRELLDNQSHVLRLTCSKQDAAWDSIFEAARDKTLAGCWTPSWADLRAKGGLDGFALSLLDDHVESLVNELGRVLKEKGGDWGVKTWRPDQYDEGKCAAWHAFKSLEEEVFFTECLDEALQSFRSVSVMLESGRSELHVGLSANGPTSDTYSQLQLETKSVVPMQLALNGVLLNPEQGLPGSPKPNERDPNHAEFPDHVDRALHPYRQAWKPGVIEVLELDDDLSAVTGPTLDPNSQLQSAMNSDVPTQPALNGVALPNEQVTPDSPKPNQVDPAHPDLQASEQDLVPGELRQGGMQTTDTAGAPVRSPAGRRTWGLGGLLAGNEPTWVERQILKRENLSHAKFAEGNADVLDAVLKKRKLVAEHLR
jgi:hypothetical protein